jgi:hypothetical protein
MLRSLDDLTRHAAALEADQLNGVDGGVFWIHLNPVRYFPSLPFFPFRFFA